MRTLFFLVLIFPNFVFSQKVMVSVRPFNQEGNMELYLDNCYVGDQVEKYNLISRGNTYISSFTVHRNRIISLKFRKQLLPLYVEPGDSITVDLSDSVKAEFLGNGAEHNRFLWLFNEKFRDDFDMKRIETKARISGVDEFEGFIFKNRKKHFDFYRNYPGNGSFSEDFKKYMEKHMTYNYYKCLLSYPVINGNAGETTAIRPLPMIMLNGLNTGTVDDEPAMISEAYRSFVIYFITYFASEANGFNKFNDYSLSADKKYSIAKQYFKGEPLRYFLTKYLYEECDRLNAETIKKLYSTLKEADKAGVCAKIVFERCGALMYSKETKKKPKAKESFSGLKLKNMEGKEASLDDFKGKVLYIDVWASWCGPCRQQFPFSRELKKKFTEKQKKQIEFLYISIDNTADIWKKAIEQNQLDGIQLLSPGGWSADITKYFNISSIPRYILIDKRGSVIFPDAKRPSEPELVDDILKLLE